MLKILATCKKYRTILHQENPDYFKLADISDNLFAYFLEKNIKEKETPKNIS